ncbi:hypothetical protein ES703_46004 [subsurface metagenome]
MTIERILLDPNAVPYTDDEIVGKVNTATANITRAGSVEAAARPIVDLEITAPKVADGVAKANLDAMAELERGYINTNPQTGEYKVTAVQVATNGKLAVDKDSVPET